MFWPFLLILSSYVSAFTFVPGIPTQCDYLTVEWSGGTPPFQLLITPKYGVPVNISLPTGSFSDGNGSFVTQLPFPEGQKIILTMSDGTGFGSGGSTDVLTVGPSVGGSCNVTSPRPAFSYGLDDALQQCNPYTFSAYVGAIQPISIMGIIPGGESFVLSPPMGPTSYTWVVDVYNDTSVIFVMIDSLSRQGGSSDIYSVISSGDNSCIGSNSPTSTSNPITPTSATSSPTDASSVTSSAPSVPSSSGTSSSSTSMPVIAATVIGALLFLAVFVTLGLFFLKKYRGKKKSWNPNSFHRDSYRIRSQTDLDLVGTERNESLSSPYQYSVDPHTPVHASAYPLFSPFSQSDSQSLAPSASFSTSQVDIDPFSSSTTPADDPFSPPTLSRAPSHSAESSMSTMHGKAAMAGTTSYKPSRFILHTDMEDTVPPDAEEDVVELPPQYTERRDPGPLG